MNSANRERSAIRCVVFVDPAMPESSNSGGHPFVVHVADLLNRPGARRRVVLTGLMAIDLDQIDDCGPVRADLDLQETGGALLVRGEVSTSFRLRCNRCLGEVRSDISAPIVQLCGEVPNDDVLGIAPDGSIDLHGVFHDELCLSAPLVPLCSKTCRGLCPICGTDLNIEPCAGHTTELGSPFAVLKGWLEESGDRSGR